MVTRLRKNERGVALLAVLLGIALMTLVVVDFAMTSGLGFVEAANQANELRASYLARSAIGVGLGLLAVDAEHSSRVNALERSLRSRNRLLEEPRPDPHWLDAVEHETAELAVAVAGLRVETMRRLEAVLAGRTKSAFPAAEIALDGWIEKLVPGHPAIEIEERYRAVLRDNRARDAAAGRTLDGPHLTDLKVIYAAKGITAADASTGEQKALLIGLVLAHARLIAEMTGLAPVLLLDEVVAHLDPARRVALYEELLQLGTQVWMTGADPALFAEVGTGAAVIEVASGQLAPKQRTTGSASH